MEILQCGQNQQDGHVDLNNHVDVFLRKYDDSLAEIKFINFCLFQILFSW